MLQPQKINPVWADSPCIVVASGSSLTADVARKVRFARWFDHWRVLVVNDAYRLLPYADILYGCDWGWWKHHDGAPKFHGERWTCHSNSMAFVDNKSAVVGTYDLRYVLAANERGFSDDPRQIHYGLPQPSSGFQAVNLALLMGASPIVMVGFDGHAKNGKHFFGEHPQHLNRGTDEGYREFSKAYPPNDRIVNATPGSTIEAYRFVDLEAILRDRRPDWNRPVIDARTGQYSEA